MNHTEFSIADKNDEAGIEQVIGSMSMGGRLKLKHIYPKGYFEYLNHTNADKKIMVVGKCHNEIVFTMCRISNLAYVNGHIVPIAQYGNLISPQGISLVKEASLYFRKLHNEEPAALYLQIIQKSNLAANRFMQNIKFEPRLVAQYGCLNQFVVSLIKNLAPIKAEIRRASIADIPSIVEKLNACKMQFSRYYKIEDFYQSNIININNIYLLFTDGKLSSVMGFIDISDVHLIEVERYNLNAAKDQQLDNHSFPLPPLNVPFKSCYLTCVACSTSEDFNALLRAIYNDLVAAGVYTFLNICLHENDINAHQLQDYTFYNIPYWLYVSTYEPFGELDGRTPYIEAINII